MTKVLLKESVAFADDQQQPTLCCPRCGSEYLHHIGVVIYDRGGEDAKTIVRTSHLSRRIETVVEPSESSANPSARRGGLAIRFYCEDCTRGPKDDDLLELTFAQHKGVTQVAWRYAERSLAEA